MTVILVVATVVLLLTIDYFYSKRRALRPIIAEERAVALPPAPTPGIVSGFELKDHLRYHPGHTWALSESPTLVRVGVDDFAARLLGKIESITLPKRGQWVRQGQRILKVRRDGRTAELVSPVEGIVMDVNEAALENTEVVGADPYGDGWLLTVNSPDAGTGLRNLLSGSLARSWMEEAAARLRRRMPALAGAVAQDGGVAVRDIAAALPDPAWQDLTKEFFLS